MNAISLHCALRAWKLGLAAVLLAAVATAAARADDKPPVLLRPMVHTADIAALIESIGPEGAHPEAFDEVYKRLLAPAGFAKEDIVAFEEHKLFTYAQAYSYHPRMNASDSETSASMCSTEFIVLKPSCVIVRWVDECSPKPPKRHKEIDANEGKLRVLGTDVERSDSPSADEGVSYGFWEQAFLCFPRSAPVPKHEFILGSTVVGDRTFKHTLDTIRIQEGDKTLLSERPLADGIMPYNEAGIRNLERWDSAYREGGNAPWDNGRPSSDLVKTVESGAVKPCTVVELGCGTGTNAIYLQRNGFDVTAIDIAPTAIALARKKALREGWLIDWGVADALNLPTIGRLPTADFIYDRGCYHGVRKTNAKEYVETVRKLSLPGTRLMILAGNANEKEQSGPPRVTEEQLRGDFGKDFDFEWLRETRFDDKNGEPKGALAWSAMLVRKPFPAIEELPAKTELPDPLVCFDGSKVRTRGDWGRRRLELKALFRQYVYGYTPPPPKIECRVTKTENALDGKATYKEVEIKVFAEPLERGEKAEGRGQKADGKLAATIHLALFVPKQAAGPAPVFLGLNKCGNHTVADHPGIGFYPDAWQHSGCAKNAANNNGRGAEKDFWCVEYLLDRGYAFATFHESDVDPDRDDFTDGVHPHFNLPQPKEMQWGTIAAWGWGLQRGVDYLVTDEQIDSDRIALIGHSRRGKTALLAAAFDERVALVVPHQSGTGGMAISRNNDQETVERINRVFPHWFNGVFKQFNGKEDRLPVDQHLLAALVAPRLLLDTEGEKDKWANPPAALKSLQAADKVWKFVGTRGLVGDGLIGEEQKITRENSGPILQYRRNMPHTLDRGFWEGILDFADAHLKNRAANF